MKKTIGVLLDHEMFKRVPAHKTGNEKIEYYNKAAKAQNLAVLFMSLAQIDFKHVKAQGWMKNRKKYHWVRCPIPSVIHNRAMPFRRDLLEKLHKLNTKSIVFNRKTRYAKYRIHSLLNKNAELRAYLPSTRRFTKNSLLQMSGIFNQMYIKPQSGSVGLGIMKISRSGHNRWTVMRLKGQQTVSRENLYSTLRRWIGSKPYLIQEGIPLARYKNRPYDIRITLQKGGGGSWIVTGMFGKVAQKGRFVTNVAQGGKAVQFDALCKKGVLPVQRTRVAVEQASLKIVRYLERKLPGLADVGLDIGIGNDGKIKFIELNGRDQRYGFKKAGMKKIWYETYQNPIRYARYLLDRKLLPD